MNSIVKKIIGASSLVALSLVTGCNETSPLTNTVEENSPVESRSNGWTINDTRVPNASAIAANDRVYVMAQDGKTLWINGAGNANGSFFPRASFSAFASDPVVKMVAGPERYAGIGSGGTGSVTHTGVYMATEGGKLFELYYMKGSYWVEEIDAPPVKDMTCTPKGTLYVLRDQGTKSNEVYEVSSSKIHIHFVSPEALDAICNNNSYEPNMHAVATSGKLLRLTVSGSSVRVENITPQHCTPQHELVTQVNPSRGLWGHAFFDSWIPSHGMGYVKYQDWRGSDYYYVGMCRDIAMDNQGYLWDAWSTGIRGQKLFTVLGE